jgi:hypothetical protein
MVFAPKANASSSPAGGIGPSLVIARRAATTATASASVPIFFSSGTPFFLL